MQITSILQSSNKQPQECITQLYLVRTCSYAAKIHSQCYRNTSIVVWYISCVQYVDMDFSSYRSFLIWSWLDNLPLVAYNTHQDNSKETIALADSGPSLFTLGTMFPGDINLTNSLSSVKLQCSLYGTSYLENRETTYRLVTITFAKYLQNYMNLNLHAHNSSCQGIVQLL